MNSTGSVKLPKNKSDIDLKLSELLNESIVLELSKLLLNKRLEMIKKEVEQLELKRKCLYAKK
jgi:hypothetical protein